MTDAEENTVLETFDFEPAEEETPAVPRTVVLSPEPLFSALLRDVIAKLWPGDAVMADFVIHVAPALSDKLGHVGAKGGAFVEQRRAAGLCVEEHYSYDQSMRAHLINGLFPVLNVARTLQSWGAPQFRYYDDNVRRLFIAGYVLHDYVKLPDVEEILRQKGIGYEQAASAGQMQTLEDIFRSWCTAVGLDCFLAPLGGATKVLHDLIYIACNTQLRWGTLHNLSLFSRLTLAPAQLDLAEQLSRLADYLAYVARTPQSAASDASIQRELATLSNRTAHLSYHHLADNRGVLTNFIHNAALAVMSHARRVPLLYAPSGVVYLEHKTAPPAPDAADIAEATIRRIRTKMARMLDESRTGIKRDGKGIKYASYYWLFFDLAHFIRLGARATFDIVREGKLPSAGKRFSKMRDGGWMDDSVDLDLPDDLRVDQLAEWCYLAEKQVAEKLGGFDTAGHLLAAMDLENLRDQFDAVPRDNRAGGVGYHWYFAAGHYLKRHPGMDPAAWRERVEGFAEALIQQIATSVPMESAPHEGDEGWHDLRDYIRSTLSFGASPNQGGDRAVFATELRRYESAKRRGHGSTRTCALCSSAYQVDKQREAAVLFAPQVYSNKLPLHGGDALRNICSICGLEMMLRQTLMNRSAATGGDFEGRRIRYLYFYPTYFFSPETLALFRRAYANIRRISFTELRSQLVSREGAVNLAPAALQRLEPLLLAPEEEGAPSVDRYVRLHFSEDEPVTFYFLGVPPPGRDAKDAESWVHPAFLALLLPLCVDIKVVASETSLPLYLEAEEFSETVVLDGPHAAISYLVEGRSRVNIDDILPTLQRLAVGYLIHMDANSGMGRGGYDYRWQDLPALARALDASPLYAFHYLRKWQRKQQLDAIPAGKAHLYLEYVEHYLNGGNAMSHARELTTLYRQFYRSKNWNSNGVLRPVTMAAHTILAADLTLFDREGLEEAVYGALHSFAERAQREGLAYFPPGSTRESREQAMKAFANYFVETVFYSVLRGDKSALRGRQLNLLKGACEAVYRDQESASKDKRNLRENDHESE